MPKRCFVSGVMLSSGRISVAVPMETALEPVLVIGAFLALASFGIWFTFFAGGGGPTVGPK